MSLQPQDILAAARATIERESASIATLVDQLDDHFVQVAYVLLNCTGHVLVAGSGTSNPVGARLAHLLSCCGTPALFIHPGDSQHGLSGATLIAFTEKPDSTLGKLSHYVLRIQAAPDVDPYGMIATGSSITVCAMADALCVALLHLRGYSKEAFAQTHPGGAVGIQLAAEGKDAQP